MRHAFLTLAFICFATTVAGAASVRDVALPADYLAAGDKMEAVIHVELEPAAPAGSSLRVTENRQVDIAALGAGKPGARSRVVLERPLAELAKSGDVKCVIDSEGMLTGAVRLLAEIVTPGRAAALSTTWADPVTVGVRHRVSLAGDWDVTKIENHEYPNQWRPKEWKVPAPTSAHLPGSLINDDFFKGWVTASRDVKWTKMGDLRPRFVRLSGVADSAVFTIESQALPETRPIEEMSILTHWNEYHSPFKGEENAARRMLFLDQIPQGPVKLTLPKALDGESAKVSFRLRATSGQFRPHPVFGITGDLHLEMSPPVYVGDIGFDTEKPGENRRFKFDLTLNNESGKEFRGKLVAVYGRYDGAIAYTGGCAAYATAEQPVTLKPGKNTVQVVHEEKPRFDTCRATFLLVDSSGKVIDADGKNFHTVTFEIADRRDFHLNNERFIVKAQGSSGKSPHERWQLRVLGGNGFRGPTDPSQINLFQSEGLLTSCGAALLASVEKCIFYNPKDTSNITKAVKNYTDVLADCPGIIIWEATNEMHGEPEEARVAIQEAFHKLDPYHRPVLGTKGSGEWEAEAHDGRVKGIDIVGCQYLLSKEGIDSVTAAITEQPILSTEVNWNDGSFARDDMWRYWLDKGVAGSLLFDYSGFALDQPVPTVPPPDNDSVGMLIKKSNRDLYQDLVATAVQQADGRTLVRLGNVMPYTLHNISIRVRGFGKIDVPDLAPGAAATLLLPQQHSPPPKEPAILRAEYTTHGGLPHIALLTPTVSPMTALSTNGGAK
jgi:hypothetical protein